jgi:predicted acyl esterase
MPVAVRRAVIARTGTAEAAGPEQRNARSDRRGAEALDVISVSPVPDGPFGQGLRYGAADDRVNALVHELRGWTAKSIHEIGPTVDESVDNQSAGRRKGLGPWRHGRRWRRSGQA